MGLNGFDVLDGLSGEHGETFDIEFESTERYMVVQEFLMTRMIISIQIFRRNYIIGNSYKRYLSWTIAVGRPTEEDCYEPLSSSQSAWTTANPYELLDRHEL